MTFTDHSISQLWLYLVYCTLQVDGFQKDGPAESRLCEIASMQDALLSMATEPKFCCEQCVLMRHSVFFGLCSFAPLDEVYGHARQKMKITSRLQTQRGGKEDLMRAFKQHVSQDATEICLEGFLSPWNITKQTQEVPSTHQSLPQHSQCLSFFFDLSIVQGWLLVRASRPCWAGCCLCTASDAATTTAEGSGQTWRGRLIFFKPTLCSCCISLLQILSSPLAISTNGDRRLVASSPIRWGCSPSPCRFLSSGCWRYSLAHPNWCCFLRQLYFHCSFAWISGMFFPSFKFIADTLINPSLLPFGFRFVYVWPWCFPVADSDRHMQIEQKYEWIHVQSDMGWSQWFYPTIVMIFMSMWIAVFDDQDFRFFVNTTIWIAVSLLPIAAWVVLWIHADCGLAMRDAHRCASLSDNKKNTTLFSCWRVFSMIFQLGFRLPFMIWRRQSWKVQTSSICVLPCK